MENSNEEYILDRLKVKIYLFILPFIIFATGVGWTMDLVNTNVEITLDFFLFPILDIWLLFCFIFLLVKKHLPRFIEIISLVFVTLIYCIWFANTMSLNLKAGSLSGGLGEFTNWVPLFFIFMFLIFDQKIALFIAMTVFTATLLIGLVMSFTYHHSFQIQTYDSLIQFYLSNATYIFALYFLQSLKTAFIQKEAIQQLANTDYLTKLPNRRYVEKSIHQYMDNEESFSVILFDIDYFKHINDTYGHDVGDTVLKEFAFLLKDNMREKDIVGRWGGEEFIILATGLNGKQTAAFSERIRKLIEDFQFTNQIKVTASFGVAEYREKERAKDLLKRADVALYLAKDRGRNKVEMIL
ncbi:GGDEF domain-containing protein [Neobacillus sp. D3-1R]|uniref:GGDEF domain-containing protein n=1 Tax=Neobacillus sp. D3-1R TaxID=3445778 RepID=UPI003FA089AE